MKKKDNVVISVSLPRDLLKDFDKVVEDYGKRIGVGMNRSAVISMAMLALILDANKKENAKEN